MPPLQDGAVPAAAVLVVEDAKAVPPPVPMVRVAALNGDMLFLGLGDPVAADQVAADAFVFGEPACAAFLPKGAVRVERDCDLPANRYRLSPPDADHGVWHFVPIESADLVATFERMVELGAGLALDCFDSPANGAQAREFFAHAARKFPAVVQRVALAKSRS